MKIGVGVPLRGPGAALGREMAQAIELAVEDANASTGTIPVRVSILGKEGSESAGEHVARTFAGDREIMAVIGQRQSPRRAISPSARLLRCGRMLAAPLLTVFFAIT